MTAPFRPRLPTALLAALAWGGAAPALAQDGGQLNVICSVQAEWCNMIQTVFARTTGIKVNMSLKGSGEALAQLIAERANPKTDVWFGGTGDPHLQAAEQGLSLEYKSAALPQLHGWAQQQAQQSGWKTVGIYSGPLGFGYNTELIAKKKMPVPKTWADLLNPVYKGEIQVANPASSGTAYTMIATLVQLMGEDKAFDYMKALHKNISQYTRSGTGADQGRGARRDHGVDQLRARRPGRGRAGLPGGHHHPGRRHRRRDRLDEHHQGRAQPRRREEVLRMGADGAGAAVRRRGQAVPAAQQQGHAAGPARSRLQVDQVHPLRLRQVRRLGRAQAADLEVGEGRQLAAAVTSAEARGSAARPARAARCWAGCCWAQRPSCCCPGTCRRTCRLWQALPGVFGGSDTASGLVQTLRHGKPWLAAAIAGLGLAGLAAALPAGRRQGLGLVAGAVLGLAGLLGSGFAIGAQGWAFASLATLFGALPGGQYGIGLGGALVLLALLMLLGAGLARLGYFRGDVFVAGAVVLCAALLLLFIALPVGKSLVGAFVDDRRCRLAGGARPSGWATSGSGAWAAWPAACAAAWPGTRCSWRC